MKGFKVELYKNVCLDASNVEGVKIEIWQK